MKQIKEEEWAIYKDNRRKGTAGALWEFSTLGNVRKNGDEYEPSIYTFNGKPRRMACGTLVYRAVAELFLPNPKNLSEIDHMDRNSLNDRVDNLRWVTHSENMANTDWETTRKKMSTAHKGKPSNHKGRRHTEESKQKMRKALKKAWARRKANIA